MHTKKKAPTTEFTAILDVQVVQRHVTRDAWRLSKFHHSLTQSTINMAETCIRFGEHGARVMIEGKEIPHYAMHVDPVKKEVSCWIASEAGKVRGPLFSTLTFFFILINLDLFSYMVRTRRKIPNRRWTISWWTSCQKAQASKSQGRENYIFAWSGLRVVISTVLIQQISYHRFGGSSTLCMPRAENGCI